MKRKADKQQNSAFPTAPRSAVSAVAARRARQQQQLQQSDSSHDTAPSENQESEPPTKKARSCPERHLQDVPSNHTSLEGSRLAAPVKAISEDLAFELSNADAAEDDLSGSDEIIIDDHVGEEEGTDLRDNANQGTPSRISTISENFTLSKNRVRKSDIVYSDEHMLCVRLKEKMTLVLIGIYDIWVKRGVISLMGAKLHPSTKTYRVYAPSTHSLPVIKCVSGVEGFAEIELQSCSSNLYGLKALSPHYSRIWNSSKTVGDSTTLNGSFKRSFSILYTSSDDPLNRPLRPLHLEKKWSTTIKSVSRRAHSLRALICGPKGAGKSTFGRYLLNHLLTPAPDGNSDNLNGVAFLDLDPGQPEFAPMGNIYLAHLREPCFGPPFSHPNLESSRYGKIVRCHHIGATSPKEDPDNYALAIMNLFDQYRMLSAMYPRCPLIINFPGWIFGLGLEVATWIIRSTALSDVVYMSEKGPAEVIEPLGHAASEASVTLTTLPSQPVDLVTRSSAQLRSMQMQSYFHMTQPEGLSDPLWTDSPLIHNKAISVSYSGPRPGISGIMVLGNRYSPQVLRDIIDGSVVAVVAVENVSAIPGYSETEAKRDGDSHTEEEPTDAIDEDLIDDNGGSNVDDSVIPQSNQQLKSLLNNSITRCPNSGLPYLFWGAGSSTPLDPKASRSLGLAFVRSIDVSSQKLELISPIPSSSIREAINQGHSLVLVRGMIDSPDWAFSEEYYAARNAEQDFIMTQLSYTKRNKEEGHGKDDDETQKGQNEELRRLQQCVRAASRLPYLKVIDDASALHQNEGKPENGTWRLRKKVYISSDSELD
ncbi:RNA processing protein Grc3, putative [Talaromyces stipitatus ATCC 10500]|uniref:Polynucleotide 5'-hydroxyl-kinase GRC3 n=1 Tax=Talaromyces stipitatus (strain ATCC 10500 / CBS 375.48 / QM 6759 / NRRL 1006) TaxID=441959 RepID=B8M6Z9_TALSN|nr:RNA processing protein Grc3, putative [Talaromyces stipitatus ATCC 10500]EED20219.1 RNA processing protein Grc3, putative [Talaromyces stipitatus ATCC 10500]